MAHIECNVITFVAFVTPQMCFVSYIARNVVHVMPFVAYKATVLAYKATVLT
jgi:hypothetical protein